MITLTTDFGDSAYVGAMRGAILRAHPDARLVDVTHAVPPQDVVAGALALQSAAPFFPDGCVHVAVVDPGVGTARRGLCIVTRRGVLVGPDNGLLVPAARALGGIERVHALENAALWAPRVAPTFHGRDVFGPVAAHLDCGGAPGAVGPRVAQWVDLDFGEWRERDGTLEGRVLLVDPFGNAITNIPGDAAAATLQAGAHYRLRASPVDTALPFRRTYGDAAPGDGLLLVSSAGFVEVAVNGGSAAARYGLRAGDAVRIGPA